MTEVIVQLRYATLPGLLRPIAVHYWFAVHDRKTGSWTRWEVWQKAHAGPIADGHVHRDLMDVDSGVGGGPARIAHQWRGADAQVLLAELSRSLGYPARKTYRAWPGPNSNTFARWILDRCRLRYSLDARAIGKDFRGVIGLRFPPREVGLALETLIGGAAISTRCVEIHFLGFTVGLSWKPLTLKTPFGDVPRRSIPVG